MENDVVGSVMAAGMSASSGPGGGRLRARLLDHLRTPLFRNGYALVASHGVTSGLGLVFWLLAARLYAPRAVGLNMALLSATMLVAVIAQLNLSQALNRFLPRAGHQAGRLIWGSYGVSALTAALAGAMFVLGAGIWAPTLGFLRSDPALGAWFVAACALWCVFVLQDGALAGLRQAGWVPLENAVFALAKIALLALPALWYGLYLAWTVPLLPIVVTVNVLLFRRLVPRHRQRTLGREEPINQAQVRRFVAGEYAAALLRTGLSHLLPLVALAVAGAEATAYFSLSATIADTLFLASGAMGMSLVAEGAHDQARLAEYTYRTGVQTARLIVPAAALLALAAPYLLRLFGPGYAAEGVTVLRLLCAAALPGIVTSLSMSMLRVQRRMRALVVVTLTLAVLVLPTSYALLRVWGIVGIGAAWLAAQTVVAVTLIATQLRPVWSAHLSLPALSRLAGLLQLVSRPVHRRRVVAGVSRVLPAAHAGGGTLGGWRVHRVLHTVNDVSVATAGPAGQPPVAVVKTASSDRGAAALRREAGALAALSADPRLGPWRRLLPEVLASGSVGGQQFVVERMMSGIDGRRCLADPERRARMLAAAAATIGELHRRTAVAATVDSGLLERWVDQPLLALQAAAPRGALDQGIHRLRAELWHALEGQRVLLGWVHGDYTPSNILCSVDGSEVRGIVDWELASPLALPDLDLCHLALTTRMLTERRELGEVVRDLLARGLAQWDGGILPWPSPPARASLPASALVLLTWLHHAAANLAKSARYQRGRPWVARNVEPVLAYLAADKAEAPPSLGPRAGQAAIPGMGFDGIGG